MTLQEARLIIMDPDALPGDLVMAAGVLTSSKDSSFEDLLACLKCKGNAAAIAATALYVRTNRRRDNFSLDYDDWRSYLCQMGLI